MIWIFLVVIVYCKIEYFKIIFLPHCHDLPTSISRGSNFRNSITIQQIENQSPT